MNNKEGQCQTQGHKKKFQLSHICVSDMCKSTSRLMCIKCKQKNIHKHDIEFYKSFTEFVDYFKNSKLPQLEFRVQQQNGNQVKCDYLKKIYEEFSKLELDLNYSGLKQQNDGIQEFCSMLVIIKQVIQEYIDQLRNEITQAQKIYDIYQYITNSNLDIFNEFQINQLLENHCQFFEKEVQNQQDINDIINKFNSIAFNYPNNELLQNALEKVRSSSIKLEKLNKNINFHIHDKFHQNCQSSRDQICEQGRYFASQQYQSKKKYQDILYIRDLISKKLIKQQFFKSYSEVKVKFDKKWKNFINYQYGKLHYYILQCSHQIKLIKKFNCDYLKDQIVFINLNKIVMTHVNQQQIQIIDFQFRKRNFQVLGSHKQYQSLLYGGEKQIIVALIHQQYNQTDYCSLNIYQEGEIKPLIVRDRIKTWGWIKQMKLFNKDSQLLTSNLYSIDSWQIDYLNQKLIQIKSLKQIGQDQNYFYQLSHLHIQKISLDKIEIFDQNFNLWFTIQFKLEQPNNYVQHLHMNNQTLVYKIDRIDQPQYAIPCNYVVLMRAKCDYELLEQ